MNAFDSPSAPAFPSETASVLLPGPVGLLELACVQPDIAIQRAGIAIICHPHPLQGGTMTNKVVTTLERSLLDLGLASVRFNFRGVGQSAGLHDNGIGETDDLVAIAAWVRAQRPGDVLWLAGFSFGSYVALRAAGVLDPAQLILIAPPAGRWDFSGLAAPACPWLIVQGESDEVVDPSAVFAWSDSLRPAPTLVRMPDTGHFFHRRLIELRAAVKDAVAHNLPAPRAA